MKSEVKSNIGKSGGLRYAFFVHQKSKHVLSNVCTSSLFFHNNVNDAARSEEKLGLVIESSRQQPPQNVQCRRKREDGWCWVYGGFIKTKEKEKARTVNKKKVGTIFPRPLNLFPPVSCFWRLDGRSLSSRWETGGAGDVFLVPDGPVLVFGPERSVAFASLLMLEALRSTSVNF